MKALKIFLLLVASFCMFHANAKQITAAEYFWDTDPGQGNGIALSAADGNLDSVIEAVVESTTSLPATGDHVFYVRVKDGNNNWGPVFKTVIVVLPSATTLRNIKVTAAEYFWDTDPGAGNGNAMVAFDGNFDNAIETAYKSGIGAPSVGTHTFYVRIQDAENNWGPVFKTVIDVLPSVTTQRQIKVASAEYFWDTDPGVGNGNAMVAFDGNFDSAIETAYRSGITPPAVGTHTFNVRVQDAENNWGPVFKTVIDVMPSVTTQRQIKVAMAEYFWDTDPGAGNGNAMVAFDGNFDSAIETAYQSGITPPAVGTHTFNVRVQDAENIWGPVFKTVIDVMPSVTTQRQIKVTAGEYFFDTDPGVGNATPMIAFDGSFSDALETLAGGSIPVVTAGVHALFMRARDAENNWGPKFGIIVNVDTSIITQTPVLKDNILRVEVYPNPFSHSLTIEISPLNNENAEIRIEDLSGRVIRELKSGFEKFSVDGSGLAAGIYLAVITKNGQNPVVKKIIKD